MVMNGYIWLKVDRVASPCVHDN